MTYIYTHNTCLFIYIYKTYICIHIYIYIIHVYVYMYLEVRAYRRHSYAMRIWQGPSTAASLPRLSGCECAAVLAGRKPPLVQNALKGNSYSSYGQDMLF